MAKHSKYIKPQQRRFLTAHVVATKLVSPSFVRVTIGGEQLQEFTPMGFDQWFRLFLPNESGVLRLPTKTNRLWVSEYMLMSSDTKPIVQNYTVRAYRSEGLFSEGPEIDIDFALHADASGQLGPASAWANSASPGAELAILDEGVTYQPGVGASWQLLVGDASALPAILGILRDAPRGLCSEVFLQVPHLDDAQQVDAPEGTTITWLTQSEAAPSPLEAIQAATLPDSPGYAFVAGGQSLVTAVRRHLVADRGFPKESITFTGYWR